VLRLAFGLLWGLSLLGSLASVIIFWSCVLPQYIKEKNLGRKLTKFDNPTPNAEKWCYSLVIVCFPLMFIFMYICLTYFN
jgi:hypothetical protein